MTISPLRPGGKAQFGDAILDVMSQGDMLPKGTAVRIISGGASLLFTGSGFYLTDYGRNAHRTQGDAPKPAGAAGGSSESAKSSPDSAPSSSSSSSESKAAPAPKSEPKPSSGGPAAP